MNKKKKSSRDRLLDVTFEEVYSFGYSGAATATILKKAEVPRGSMYHHFPSKKAMVIAMINERLIPKVREFFSFEIKKDVSVIVLIESIFKKISKNKMLVIYGCPLHRLMFEMDNIDSDISKLCSNEFDHLSQSFEKLLSYGMKEGSIKKCDSKAMANFILASSWGILSKPATHSSKEQYLQDSQFFIELLKA